jgi:hypothetical protein
MANLRDKEDYASTIWDWSPFNDCFAPTNIRMTDIDGFVERHGHFLLIETKRPGAIVPTGQSIMFNAMISTGLFTVLVIWGETNKPELVKVMKTGGRVYQQRCNIKILKDIIKSWFDYANDKANEITISEMDIVISLALDIQREYLTGGDISFLAGQIAQRVYNLRDTLKFD